MTLGVVHFILHTSYFRLHTSYFRLHTSDFVALALRARSPPTSLHGATGAVQSPNGFVFYGNLRILGGFYLSRTEGTEDAEPRNVIAWRNRRSGMLSTSFRQADEIPRYGCPSNRHGMTLGVDGCPSNRHAMTLGVGYFICSLHACDFTLPPSFIASQQPRMV